MKKFTSIFAIVLALVLCLGAMTACTGGKEDPTQKPGTSTPAGDNKPEGGENEGNTESQPEGGENTDNAQSQG